MSSPRPAASVGDALDLIEQANRIDEAVLDLNLRGELALPVADALLARNVPFMFATGYDRIAVPERYTAVTRCEKPMNPDRVVRALFG